jgi:hypothetical protein
MLLKKIILELLFSVPAGTKFDLHNTSFFSILQANPSLAVFYGDFCRRHRFNSSILKDLEVKSGIIFNPDQSPENPRTPANQKGSTMSTQPSLRLCTHIKVNGVPCGSPAMREEVFCYFHQRMIRGVRTPPKSRLHPMALIENPASIQASLMEVINAVVRNQIDIERARVLLRALHIAVKNAPAAHYDTYRSEMVQEVPQYPDAPPGAGPFTLAVVQARALAFIENPPEEETEDERLSAAFARPSIDPTQRKPPTSVKRAGGPRAIAARVNESRSQPYQ